MFEGLRKKFSDAVKGFIKKEEAKSETTAEQQQDASSDKEEIQEEVEEESKQEQIEEAPKPEKKEEPIKEAPAKNVEKEKIEQPKQKKEEIIKLSLKTKIKSVFISSIKLSESEIEGFTDVLKLSMLESDVSYSTTEQFIDDLTSKLKSKEINSKHIREEVTNTVRDSLLSILEVGTGKVNIDELVRKHKESNELPVKILFLGPNGAGKTTTIAKIGHHFKSKGISIVFSASDTFRAAAIEQIEHHAKKLGLPVIKSGYGADPASITFDAIAYAKAHRIELVLIDSAGRQETNKSLISEIQKMVKVSKPDVTIFVGESTSGNQIAEQIKEFNKFIKIDGIILTKLDCDAKGGGAISISHTTGIPILYFGVGEGYDALMPYDPNFIVNAILPANN